jgi:hypothetical protein
MPFVRVAPSPQDAWHGDALVLVTASGPPSGAVAASLAVPRPLPRTRLLPNLVTDGFGQGRLRVYMSHPLLPREVALRPQTGLTGSGSHRSSYGGFGGGHPTSTCIPAAAT